MLPRLYVITDRTAAERGCGSVLEACRAAADAGARLFQIRDKGAPGGAAFEHAQEIVTMLAGYGATVLINDRADIAAAVSADGVHRPQAGLPMAALRRVLEQRLVAVSCHDARELFEAERDHASFVTLGPVFGTPSKPGARPLGIAGLSAAVKLVDVPVFALGGITPDNARECMAAGVYGVAVLSGIMAAPDPYAATRAYLAALGG